MVHFSLSSIYLLDVDYEKKGFKKELPSVGVRGCSAVNVVQSTFDVFKKNKKEVIKERKECSSLLFEEVEQLAKGVIEFNKKINTTQRTFIKLPMQTDAKEVANLKKEIAKLKEKQDELDSKLAKKTLQLDSLRKWVDSYKEMSDSNYKVYIHKEALYIVHKNHPRYDSSDNILFEDNKYPKGENANLVLELAATISS